MTSMLLFDLDGTLLKSDKTISLCTLNAISVCRNNGILIGVSTSRSRQNSLKYLAELSPDIIVSSGGALISYSDDVIYTAQFSADEVNHVIRKAREICGADCEITVDTIDSHYWNYKLDPKTLDNQWDGTVYCDFSDDFNESSLKICVEIKDDKQAEILKKHFREYDCIRFTDGYWYKFTKKEATKENAIIRMCAELGISAENIIAFGDDIADIGMLKMCGIGAAMGNSVDEAKAAADIVIGSNDEDGIALYLKEKFREYFL